MMKAKPEEGPVKWQHTRLENTFASGLIQLYLLVQMTKLSIVTPGKSNNIFSCNGNIFVGTYILFANWLSVTTSNSNLSNGVIFQKWLEQNK